jgi:hypothetical protein
MTGENDLVLVYFEDKPLFFARIETISPDVKRGWYHITLLVLQIPVQVVTWILRDAYINGEEFTMGGKRMRMERIVSPVKKEKTEDAEKDATRKSHKEGRKGAEVISLSDLKKE